MNPMRFLANLTICVALVLGPLSANALLLDEPVTSPGGAVIEVQETAMEVSQGNNGKSLSEAVEQVRRQTGGRILSAETKMQGDREMHHIKVLTKDGKVKTHKIQGRKRGG
jgi:DNA-binding transcriptional ArsR family regulator